MAKTALRAVRGATARDRRDAHPITDGHARHAFAHSVDDRESDLELGALTEDVVALLGPAAIRRRVELEAARGPVEVRIRSDPFRLQHALHLAVEQALSQASEGDRVVLSLAQQSDTAHIAIESPRGLPLEGSDAIFLGQLMADLGGELQSVTRESGPATLLVLPM